MDADADAFDCDCVGFEDEEEDVPVRCGGEGGVEVIVEALGRAPC